MKITPILKVLLMIGIGYLVYEKLMIQNDILSIWNDFYQNGNQLYYYYIIFALFLMPINWYLEAEKWRLGILQYYPLDLFDSFKSVLAGITVGLITPGRIGEYGGRLIKLPKGQWIYGGLATLYTSLTQNIITVIFGLIGLSIILGPFDHQTFKYESLIVYSGIILLIILILFFLAKNLLTYFPKLPWFKKLFGKQLNVKDLGIKLFLRLLLLSFFRYLIYTTQFILLLYAMGIQVEVNMLVFAVWTTFLIQTGLPLPPFLGVLANGQIALLVLSYIEVNEIVALLGSINLWVINLIVPALLGLFVIYSSKTIERSDTYD